MSYYIHVNIDKIPAATYILKSCHDIFATSYTLQLSYIHFPLSVYCKRSSSQFSITHTYDVPAITTKAIKNVGILIEKWFTKEVICRQPRRRQSHTYKNFQTSVWKKILIWKPSFRNANHIDKNNKLERETKCLVTSFVVATGSARPRARTGLAS